MRKAFLGLVIAITVLAPTKSHAVFEAEEMEAWSDHIFVCGEMFQRLASAGVEDVAIDMKHDLLTMARRSGGSQVQLLKLDEVFEEGRSAAEYEGFVTGTYPREIDMGEYAEFGERVYKQCTDWSYAGPA